MPTTFPVETLTAPRLLHRFLSRLPGAERPGEWVAPRPLIWGGPPGSADEGQSEGCLLSSCHLNCQKEIRDSGKLKVFFHEPDLDHSRLLRKSGDGMLQDTDKKCRQGHSQAFRMLSAVGLSPRPSHCPLSIPLTPAPCHSLEEDADFGDHGPSCLPRTLP